MSRPDGPERLEVDRPPLRARTWWWVLGVALVVVAALAVVRVQVPTPAPPPGPSPSGPVPSSGSSSQSWPSGAGLTSGTLVVLTDDGVRTVDTSSGFVDPVVVDADPAETVLTPLAPGVLVWSATRREKRIVVTAGQDGPRVRGPLRAADSVLPGPTGTVWATTGAGRPGGSTTWVQADGERATGARARVRGIAVPDGVGGLFDVDRTTVDHVGRQGRQDLGRGYVRAVGPDGYLLDRCVDGTCTPELHEGVVGQVVGRVVPLGPAVAPDPLRASAVLDPGALSAGNRFVAEVVATDVGTQVQVSLVGPPSQVLRRLPAGTRRAGFVWLSSHWLAATSGDRLVLYDAVAGTLLTPDLPFAGPTQPVLLPA